MPNTGVVFITATDVLGLGCPVYNINRTIAGADKVFDDGSKIVYVNGSWRGDDDIGRLMEDFAQRDCDKMHYKTLAARARGIKNPEVMNKKEDTMSEEAAAVLKKYSVAWLEEGMEKGVAKTARAMLEHRLDIGLIADCTGLSPDEVAALQQEAGKVS